MSHRYFTLLARDENGQWAIEFGDYNRGVVQDELEDYLDHDYRRSNLKIVETLDDQASIYAAVARLAR